MRSRRHFENADIRMLRLGGAEITPEMENALLVPTLRGPYAWSFVEDGRIFAAGGILKRWKGRAEAWCIMASPTRADMLWLTRILPAVFETTRAVEGLRRLEATTNAEWEPGNRWLEILGFSPEGVLRMYDPSGRAHRMYAKIWPS